MVSNQAQNRFNFFRRKRERWKGLKIRGVNSGQVPGGWGGLGTCLRLAFFVGVIVSLSGPLGIMGSGGGKRWLPGNPCIAPPPGCLLNIFSHLGGLIPEPSASLCLRPFALRKSVPAPRMDLSSFWAGVCCPQSVQSTYRPEANRKLVSGSGPTPKLE